MAAGPIGSVWKTGTWTDTCWTEHTWAGAVVPTPPVVTSTTLSGGGRRTWSEIQGTKDPNTYTDLTEADEVYLFPGTITREDAIAVAVLLAFLDDV